MSASLRDVAFALDPPAPVWSLRESLALGLWPSLASDPEVSLLELAGRLAPAGAALREVAAGGSHAWTHMHRKTIVSELRDRLRDPAIVHQSPTSLCGPFAVLLELGRSHPARYVRAVGRLLQEGVLTTPVGADIVAEPDLRGRDLPAEWDSEDWKPGEVDWMLAATMREDENVTEDVDDGDGWESYTLPGAMERWTRDLLGLESQLQTCWSTDELKALQVARHAVDAGGVAFMLIDKNLILDGGSDDEEEMRWRSTLHVRRQTVGPFGPLTHSEDDSDLPRPMDHWAVYLGGLTPSNPSGGDQITLRLWSWRKEFEMKGTADAFGEYLYAVVAGFPK